MKILVTGCTSGLGKYLYGYLKADGLKRGEKITQYYDLIIHCAHDHKSALENVKQLQDILSAPHGKLVYISSVERYKCFTDDAYAASKGECEAIIRLHSDNYLILRPGVLLGSDMRPNTLTRMFAGEKIRLSPESTMGFVRHETLAKWIGTAFALRGTYDVCGDPVPLWVIAEKFGINPILWGDHTYVTPAIRSEFDSINEIRDFIQHDLASDERQTA